MYYLIARNRRDNSFTVLKLRETWYLGQERGREDAVIRGGDLEAIDLVTTRFGSEGEMAERMAMNGYIPDSNVDIFIASKRKKDGKTFIKFDEVIYNRNNAKRAEALRRIARTSLVTNFKDDSYDLNVIYDEIIAAVYTIDDYLAILESGDTNVPSSFVGQLSGICQYSEVPYELKQQAHFGVGSYAGVRSIVESLNRLESLSNSSREDRFASNVEFVERNLSGRLTIASELATQLDENYVEGQMSLFATVDEDCQTKRQEMVSLDSPMSEPSEKKVPEEIVISRSGVSDNAKRIEVFRVLRSIPANAFVKDDASGRLKVNYDLFTHCMPTETESKKLNTYLTGKMPNYFYDYMVDYRRLCNAREDGFTSQSEISELQKDIEHDVKKIENRFKSAKCLNMTYEWCLLYEGALKREAGTQVDPTIGKAKVYEKK